MNKRIHWFRVDRRPFRVKHFEVSKISGFVWTGPHVSVNSYCAHDCSTPPPPPPRARADPWAKAVFQSFSSWHQLRYFCFTIYTDISYKSRLNPNAENMQIEHRSFLSTVLVNCGCGCPVTFDAVIGWRRTAKPTNQWTANMPFWNTHWERLKIILLSAKITEE